MDTVWYSLMKGVWLIYFMLIVQEGVADWWWTAICSRVGLDEFHLTLILDCYYF